MTARPAARAVCTCGVALSVGCGSEQVVDAVLGRFAQLHGDHHVTVTRAAPVVEAVVAS